MRVEVSLDHRVARAGLLTRPSLAQASAFSG
jgi:hypothetical protein